MRVRAERTGEPGTRRAVKADRRHCQTVLGAAGSGPIARFCLAVALAVWALACSLALAAEPADPPPHDAAGTALRFATPPPVAWVAGLPQGGSSRKELVAFRLAPVRLAQQRRATGHVQEVEQIPAQAPQAEAVAPPKGVFEEEAVEGVMADFKPIGRLAADIALPEGTAPTDYAAEYFRRDGQYFQASGPEAGWMRRSYYWQATGLCHRPLYFEEVNLERYGYECGVCQPLASAAHFFGTIPLLPYRLVAEPPRECVYTLGQHRPGSYAPLARELAPPRLDAALVQGAVVTGLIFIIP